MSKDINEKIKSGREYRNMYEVRAAEEAGLVEGYATTFNSPYMLFRMDNYEFWEQVDPMAFSETDMSDVIMQYDHEGRVFARLSNKTLALDIDAHGLHVSADLSGTEIGRQLYEEIKGGYTNKMSFGFTVDKDERTTEEDKETHVIKVMRTIKSIGKLYDVSAVSLPANDATAISARTLGEGVIAQVEEEFRKEAEAIKRRNAQIAKIKILSEV